jgi:branched-chain amino acid transport system substrate-binding protein
MEPIQHVKGEVKMKKFLVIAVTVLLLLPLIFGGCEPAAPEQEEILIGTPAPMTGVFAGFGEGCVYGMQAAIDDINAQGGIYMEEYGTKLPVRLVVADCESDPVKVATLAEDLVLKDKVHALLSPDEPVNIHGPVATVADKYKVPHIIGGGPFEPWNGQRMEVTPPWEYTWMLGFRIVMPYPEGDFRAVPGYTIRDSWFQMLDMYADQTNKVAGVFASDDADGIGWYGLFPGALQEYGLTVVGAEQKLGLFPLGTTDFTPIINQWKANDVEILWGNCPGADFGTLWKQCNSQAFKPKIVTCGRAPLFYVDASSWGGNLPWGVGVEVWWDRVYPADSCPGIGSTTAESLTQRWIEDTGQPLNPAIGHGYLEAQVLIDAIGRAGVLDGTAIKNAISETDMPTINGRMKFIQEEHFSGLPLAVGQWVKTDKAQVWDLQITFSQHDWLKPAHEPIFPIP